MLGIDGCFALMLKIDCDTIADDGLDLTKAPIRLVGMAYQHAWFEE